jgi:hypothetical protein
VAWLNLPQFSIDEAQQRGFDVYEVLFSDWGMTNPLVAPFVWDQWPPFPSPAISKSLAALAIGPRSTVDRAWLTYNLQKNANVFDPANPPTTRVRHFSVDAPLLFVQPAGAPGAKNFTTTPNIFSVAVDQVATMVVDGSMYVWPFGQIVQPDLAYQPQNQTTMVQNNQYIDINGVTRPLPPPDNGSIDSFGFQLNWVGPSLHLMLYLKPPLFAPPTKRTPLQAMATYQSTLGAATEGVLAVIATFGRRNAHIMMMADQICDFRVAALREGGFNPSSSITAPIEEPVGSITGVAANTPTILPACSCNGPIGDYTIIYVTPQGGGTPNVRYQISAYD